MSLPPPDTEAVPVRVAADATSSVVLGLLGLLGIAVFRTAWVAGTADRDARLMVVLSALGVWIGLLGMVVSATAAGPRAGEAKERLSITGFGLALAGFISGVFSVMLLFGSVTNPDLAVRRWQVETDPVAAVLVGLCALVLAVAARRGADLSAGSRSFRRLIAIAGAAAASTVIRRAFGRTGDAGPDLGPTLLLVALDLASLAIVAVVAYRSLGAGR